MSVEQQTKIEQPNTLNKQEVFTLVEYRAPLVFLASDTDDHTSRESYLVNSETFEIIGPKMTDGDIVSITYLTPEIFIFGKSEKFEFRSISAKIVFVYPEASDIHSDESIPTNHYLTEGECVLVNQVTRNEKTYTLNSDARIPFRARIGDGIVVTKSNKNTHSVIS